MKVCITTSDNLSHIGGSEWSIRRVADYIADAGYQVDIACLDLDTVAQTWRAEIPGVTPLRGWRPEIRLFQLHKTGGDPALLIDHRGITAALERLHALFQYDMFHAFFLSTAGFLTALTGRRVGRPVIISARGSDINRDAYSSVRFASVLWTLQHATYLTFVSEALLSWADAITPCRERAEVILNATSRDFFALTPDWALPKPQGFVVGGAGVLSYKKNWAELLEIVTRLRGRSIPATLLWIGEMASAERAMILSAIKDLGLNGAVVLTGRVPHMAMLSALSLLDVFVMTSLDEGCPNACLEAMLAARPVVAYAVGALPELIRSGEEGLLLAPTATDAFVDIVANLFHDRALAARLGQAAQRRVLTEFTPHRERAQWVACYKHILTHT
jgi:glycosyltransferase involved in cell wall biosynthesis